MDHSRKTKAQLIAELEQLRQELTAAISGSVPADHPAFAADPSFQALVNALPDVIYRLAADGTIVFISQAIRQYGHEPADLLGTSIFDLIHPEDRAQATHRVNERRTGERRTRAFEVRLLTAKEDAVPFELKSSPDSDATLAVHAEGVYASDRPEPDRFLYTQGVARDVSERKQMEQTLAASEEKFRHLAENSADVIYTLDMNERLTYVSPSVERILG